jgi:hypothetical protein
MGARRMTNDSTAVNAGVSIMTVSRIRNGDPSVGFLTLKKVVEAVGLQMIVLHFRNLGKHSC